MKSTYQENFFSRFKTNITNFKERGWPKTGLFHYSRSDKEGRSRIHLRIDPDGNGLILVNANRVMHLNPTAVLMAYLALENTPSKKAIQRITSQFTVSAQQAEEDYTNFVELLDELIRPVGACPIHDLNLEVALPFSARPSAPYRMDLALTYRCNNDCFHCYNSRPRCYPELSTEEWKRIVHQLWDLGIPHIVFTGGEPTLREDLKDLISYAESLGHITGLNTNGRRLSDPHFLQQMVEAGLDHVQITLESHDPTIHDDMVNCRGAWEQTVKGIKNALDSPLFVMTNTTMLQPNSPHLRETLLFLTSLGVPTIGLNALIYSGRGLDVGTGLAEEELTGLLEFAKQHTQANHQRLIWYTPTQYCHFDPMQLELGVKGCTAALYNMCIEPDGNVIPCQSYYQPLGNILRDSWKSIWNHDLAIYLRERKYVASKCKDCILLPECGGGCPLHPPSTERR